LAEVQEEIETQRHGGHREKLRGEMLWGGEQRGAEGREGKGRGREGEGEGKGRGREGQGKGRAGEGQGAFVRRSLVRW
jgi:hypothetical protein